MNELNAFGGYCLSSVSILISSYPNNFDSVKFKILKVELPEPTNLLKVKAIYLVAKRPTPTQSTCIYYYPDNEASKCVCCHRSIIYCFVIIINIIVIG